ncbi:MAG: zinc-binding dehydrogenase [Fidelibacterota bacterium]|nr:MAG: zinc-binding dehydrogenase [Candidatus Neomarinimicrobiota bacterium]
MTEQPIKRIQVHRHGGPRVLRVVEGPRPDTEPGEILIRTHFAGINFADIMTRMGLYPGAPKLPAVPGIEVAGEVVAVGSGVSKVRPGERVLALTRFGGYSGMVAVPARQVRTVPETISLELVAGLPVTYLTAYLMMFDMGNLKAGESILVHSAGGGVGTAAVQLAWLTGARVFGTASSSKHARLKQMGVDLCIDYNKEDFVQRIMDTTDGRGVDLILDAQGPLFFKRSYQALAPFGTLVMYGVQHNIGRTRLLSAPLKLLREVLAIRFAPVPMMSANRGIYGFHLGHLWHHLEPVEAALEQLLAWLGEGKINPIIDRIFPYYKAAQAHAYIQDRKNFGKVLLDFREVE